MKEAKVDREDDSEWQGVVIPDSIGNKVDPFTIQSYSQMSTCSSTRFSCH